MCSKLVILYVSINFFWILKSGLRHIGVSLFGDGVNPVIVLTSRQAFRVVEITGFLKQLCFSTDRVRKGKSVFEMLLHSVCSISSHWFC